MAESNEEGNSLQSVTKKFVFEFYENFTKDEKKVKGKCKTCKKEIRADRYNI